MTIKVEAMDIKKELVAAQQNGFLLQDNIEAVNMGNMAKPRLLTVLFGGADTTANVYGSTSVFQYDETKYTPVSVSGKRFDERGKDIGKDSAKTRYFEIGSKGIRLNVAPEDYDGRRKAGTQELLTEADVLADQIAKAQDAFAIEAELEMAYLMTAGKNRTAGGPSTEYDFHLDILGSTRPAATSVDFSAPVVAPDVATRKIVNKLEDTLAAYGLSSNGVVVLCGDNYFDAAYEFEKQINIARDLRSTVDLVSQAMPKLQAGDYRYDNFVSATSGVTYIRYGAKFFGSQLVGTNDAYMVPMIVGDTLVKNAFAPAKVQGIVNTQAREMYSWFYSDIFTGVTGFYEQNKLPMLPRPNLIISLVKA